MTTNNDATRALEELSTLDGMTFTNREESIGIYAAYFSANKDIIRTALLKSAQVDGLIEIVTAIRDTATGDSVTISAIKEAAREQLKQFSATEI